MGFTVFLNCLNTFFESMPRFLKTLNTNPKTTHTKCKTLYILQKATLLSKQCCHLKRVLCFLMTNTAHYMSRHSKHRLNTDVLNGKHYYEMGKHQYEGLIRNIMLLYAYSCSKI